MSNTSLVKLQVSHLYIIISDIFHLNCNLCSGVGKTSLVHLIMKSSSVASPSQTVGCSVSVKVSLLFYRPWMNLLLIFFVKLIDAFLFFQHTTYGSSSGSSSSIKGDAERGFFIELWDISGHERYKDCRSLFYSQINGKQSLSEHSSLATGGIH